MERWYVHTLKADFNEIGRRFSIDPVIARVIRNRGLSSMDEINLYLNGTCGDLYSPQLLKRAEESALFVVSKIREGKQLRVIGDYDIDGVCSACILVRGLRRVGAKVDYDIPERIRDGYGLNESLIEKASRDGVDVIITCDNGIAAISAVERANELGIEVVVTDHHEPPYVMRDGEKELTLPPARYLIDPRLPDETYPYPDICGAVVAWKWLQMVFMTAGLPGDAALDYLELAAFATVGDVMDLSGENRIIVKEGLKALTETGTPGLMALKQVCELEDHVIDSYHIGFVLGPCINAGGRLDTALKSLRLLLADSLEEALPLARELKSLNEERKDLTQQGVEAAVELIEGSAMKEDRVLVVHLPDCHESIAGIIAGRVRELYYRPTIILTDSLKESDMAKGSGRSIEGYRMFDELNKCRELLVKFGGHPMAAGLSLKKSDIESLRRKLNEVCEVPDELFQEKVMIDVPMPLSYISENLIDQLSLLEPCGKGNEKPLFAEKDLRILSARVLGKNKNVLKLSMCGQSLAGASAAGSLRGRPVDALYFGDPERLLGYLREQYSHREVEELLRGRPGNMRLSIVYYPSINEFRGERNIQVVIRYFK